MEDTIKIDKEAFIRWSYNDKDDYSILGELAINYLIGKNKEQLSLDYILSITGYLPVSFITNLNEVNLYELGYVYEDNEADPEELIENFNIVWV
jgi:hypothetical protein